MRLCPDLDAFGPVLADGLRLPAPQAQRHFGGFRGQHAAQAPMRGHNLVAQHQFKRPHGLQLVPEPVIEGKKFLFTFVTMRAADQHFLGKQAVLEGIHPRGGPACKCFGTGGFLRIGAIGRQAFFRDGV